MTPRMAAVGRHQRQHLVKVAVCWLMAVDDKVAAVQPKAEREMSALHFIEGSDWQT